MSDFFESVRALDAANTARQDLVALVGMIVFADTTGVTIEEITETAWQIRSRLGMSRADWEIEMAGRRVENEISIMLASIAITAEATA